LKNIAIVLLTVLVVLTAFASIVMMQTSYAAVQMAGEKEKHVHRLLELSGRLEAANEVCLGLMESSIKRREVLLREVSSARRDDKVRRGSGRTHKGGSGKRGARPASF
jgi:hypothetical protein